MSDEKDVQPAAASSALEAQASTAPTASEHQAAPALNAAEAQAPVNAAPRTVADLGLHPSTSVADLQDPPVPTELLNVPRQVKVDEAGRKYWAPVLNDSQKSLAVLMKACADFEAATGYKVYGITVPRAHFAEFLDGRSGLPVPTPAQLAAGPLKVGGLVINEAA